MSKEFTKEDVIQNKKEAIRSLNRMLESYINDPSEKHLKKANLISYWLKDYVRLINFEEKFNPTKNIAYKRGNIIKLNFGFNIGSEYGGLHYAVVLDNKNDHSSPVLTVVPLTSIKESKKSCSYNVELGNEIYRLLKLKYDTISKSLKEEHDEIQKMMYTFNALVDIARSTFYAGKALQDGCDDQHKKMDDTNRYLNEAIEIEKRWIQKLDHNSTEQVYLEKIGNEIAQMKEGSIALVNQITTISKMRIFDPRNLGGVLAGISLSEESMEKINQKVKDLYVF